MTESKENGELQRRINELTSELEEARARIAALESERHDYVIEAGRLTRQRDEARQHSEDGCHWACLDAMDDEGLPMVRSHHPECAKERYRRAEAEVEHLKLRGDCASFGAQKEIDDLRSQVTSLELGIDAQDKVLTAKLNEQINRANQADAALEKVMAEVERLRKDHATQVEVQTENRRKRKKAERERDEAWTKVERLWAEVERLRSYLSRPDLGLFEEMENDRAEAERLREQVNWHECGGKQDRLVEHWQTRAEQAERERDEVLAELEKQRAYRYTPSEVAAWMGEYRRRLKGERD